MKKVAILQSNYIPWKGYFDLIAAVDEFVLYDDMQYTRRDWRNRNQIKTPQGLKWLSVPVQVKGKYHQTIKDTTIDGEKWGESHWNNLRQNYRDAPHFDEIAEWLEPFYLEHKYTHLSQLNHQLIEAICSYLGINTVISSSWDYELIDGKTERLAAICAQTGAAEYVSGPAARDYIDDRVFEAMHINLSWFDYSSYPEYPQLYGDFVHGVTILDLFFNCGAKATDYMKYVRP